MSRESFNDHKIEVVYIVGAGRSGSTLLANIVGNYTDFFNAGEIRYLYNRNMQKRNIPCQCGQLVEYCNFWASLRHEIKNSDINYATRNLTIKKNLSLFIRVMTNHLLTEQDIQLIDSMKQTYSYISEMAREGKIVDASEHPSYCLMLTLLENIDLRMKECPR